MVLNIFPINSLMSRIWIWSSFWISITLEVWEAGGKHRLDVAKIMSIMTNLWKVLKFPAMTKDDPRWVQGGSESFPDHQSFTNKVTIWRPDTVQKTPPRSHMKPQNHHKIHKYLVLAHNIHKDCLLGVAKGFSDIYGSKHSPPSFAQRGPKGKIKISTQKYSKSASNASF